MSTIDRDVLFEHLLPKLPAKSLKRFKCVSKSFETEISSHRFAQLYLDNYKSNSSDTNDLLVLPGGCDIKCYDLNSTVIATFTWGERSSVSVVGSTTGLLCIFTRTGGRLTVLNLSTRICHDICFPNGGHGLGHNFGLGFDYGNLDFKIVDVWDHHDKSAVKTRTTRVYSLITKSWETIETTLPTDAMEERHGGVLINNSLLHWMFWSPSLRQRRIGCFDVCKNKWVNDVLLPRYYYDPTHKNYLLEFGVFDDCLYSSFKNVDESCFEVWVMKKYGVQDSWVKLFSISDSSVLGGGVVPVARRGGSDEILIRVRHSTGLLWYNTKDGGMHKAVFDKSSGFFEPSSLYV